MHSYVLKHIVAVLGYATHIRIWLGFIVCVKNILQVYASSIGFALVNYSTEAIIESRTQTALLNNRPLCMHTDHHFSVRENNKPLYLRKCPREPALHLLLVKVHT